MKRLLAIVLGAALTLILFGSAFAVLWDTP
jgi:hypothetical protein